MQSNFKRYQRAENYELILRNQNLLIIPFSNTLMGIFNLFKKPQENKTEQVKFEILEAWIKSRNKRDKETIIIKEVVSELKEAHNKLKQNLSKLETVDLAEKRVESKIKHIIQENFSNYQYYLEKLISEIGELIQQTSGKQEQPPQNLHQTLDALIKKINSIFFSFEKKSESSFQKATYLIGEIGKVKESINEFFKSLKRILRENQELIEEFKIISSVKDKLTELKSIEKTNRQIKNSIDETEDILKGLNLKNLKLKNIINKIRNSDEYKQELKNQQNIENQKQSLEKEIYLLKQLINFKELANICHSNEKEMKIIKDYRENFKEEFEKDRGVKILDIINSIQKINMDKQTISKKIMQITEAQEQLKNLEDNLELITSADILIKESEIKEIDIQTKTLITQQIKEKKMIEKNQANIQEIKDAVKQLLEKLSIELI